MEERRRRDESGQRKSGKRSWCLGDEAFRQELLAQLEPRSGRHHGGRERHLHRQTRGKLPIIGVGGILAAADAWEKIAAGVRRAD